MKNKLMIVFSILAVTACNDQKKNYILNDVRLNQYIENLNDSDWETVYKAKDSLEKLEFKSLPYLIQNLNKKDEFVKLKNTTDLIYPGSTVFYGECWVVPYDLDWISIRTGWVIEEITFENFGFKEINITEDELIKLQKDHSKYQECVQSGKYDFKITPDKLELIENAIRKVVFWWQTNSESWNRLQGITDALKSNDYQRQSSALKYLTYGEYCIDGLTRNYFDKELRSVLEDLLNSEKEPIRQKAKSVLDAVDYNGNMIFDNMTTRCWN